jgi:hypothetical protein
VRSDRPSARATLEPGGGPAPSPRGGAPSHLQAGRRALPRAAQRQAARHADCNGDAPGADCAIHEPLQPGHQLHAIGIVVVERDRSRRAAIDGEAEGVGAADAEVEAVAEVGRAADRGSATDAGAGNIEPVAVPVLELHDIPGVADHADTQVVADEAAQRQRAAIAARADASGRERAIGSDRICQRGNTGNRVAGEA